MAKEKRNIQWTLHLLNTNYKDKSNGVWLVGKTGVLLFPNQGSNFPKHGRPQ